MPALMMLTRYHLAMEKVVAEETGETAEVKAMAVSKVKVEEVTPQDKAMMGTCRPTSKPRHPIHQITVIMPPLMLTRPV